MESAVVFNIQRFCLHDGGGIRTTFFFKGCPLRCKWCHNPEGQAYDPQVIFFAERCRYCAICGSNCIYGAKEVSGKAYTCDELIRIAEKDTEFYKSSGGGVNLSGGEVLTQSRAFLRAFTKGLKHKGIHVAIDTCGHVPFEAFENVLPYADIFLYDIKLFDSAKHLEFTGLDNELILSNLKKLSSMGVKLEIRVPVIEGVNNDDDEINKIIQYIAQNIRVERVRLLPYHAMGADKYERFGMVTGTGFSEPSAERMHVLTERCRQSGLPVD